jgi:hypothetical protein
MTIGNNTVGGTSIGSTGSAVAFESASLSTIAQSAVAESTSASEVATGASLSFAIGAERKVLRDGGNVQTTTSLSITEATAAIEDGRSSSFAATTVNSNAIVRLFGTANGIASAKPVDVGFAVETPEASFDATPFALEGRVRESGRASTSASMSGEIGRLEAAKGRAVVSVFGIEGVTASTEASVSVLSLPEAAETVIVSQVNVSDVEKYAALGWQQLEPEVKNTMLQTAQALIENQFTDRTSTLPTLVGDKDDATELLAAHLFDLAEGGEAQSEGGEAGNVTYNTSAGETLNSLTETRYGRLFADVYLRDRMGIGVVRSR